MKNLFQLNNWKEVYFYAAFYRIAICVLLLVDLLYSIESNKLLLSSDFSNLLLKSSFFDVLYDNIVFFNVVYAISILIYLFGIFNFLGAFFFFFLFSLNSFMFVRFHTWGDKILFFSLMYFIFVNSYNYFTLSQKNIELNKILNLISHLALACLVIHVFYIYGVNIFHKLQCKSWLYGSAISIGIVVRQSAIIFPEIIELSTSKLFSQVVSYITIFQQLFFIPLAIINKTRLYIILLTIAIHLAIALMFLLVKFQLILLFSVGFVMYLPSIKNKIIEEFKK